MSFWDKAAQVGKEVGKGMLKQSKELVAFKQEISSMDDEELESKSKSWGLNSMEKKIIAKEMSDRGL